MTLTAPGDPGSDAYERGVRAGQVEQRLQEHAEHLAKINGSMERVAEQLQSLVLGVQQLNDQQIARDATVLSTANALRDAETARRRQADKSWSPIAKLFAAIGAAAAVITVALGIILAVVD